MFKKGWMGPFKSKRKLKTQRKSKYKEMSIGNIKEKLEIARKFIRTQENILRVPNEESMRSLVKSFQTVFYVVFSWSESTSPAKGV